MIGTYATPLEALQWYIAIKQHFANKKYDVFKTGCVIRLNKDHLEERVDKRYFFKLSEEYLIGDLRDYYMANILAGRKHPSEMEDVIFREWKSRMHSLPYSFEQDLKTLVGLGKGLKPLFKTSNGKLPIVLQALNGGHISLETLCIINSLTSGATLNVFDAEIKDKLTYDGIRLRIVKYNGWVKSNDKLKQIFLNYINK